MDIFGNKETIEEFNNEIKQLSINNQLLKSSMAFFESKLKLINSDGIIEDYEQDLINEQLEYHKKLKLNKDSYNLKAHTLSNNSKHLINSLFKEIEGTIISDIELKLIDNKIKTEKNKITDTFTGNTYRDQVEKYINIKGEIETLYESESVSKLYELITLKYINLLENKYTEKELIEINKGKIGLKLEKEEVRIFIYELIKENLEIFKNINEEFNMMTTSGTFIIETVLYRETVEKDLDNKYKLEQLNLLLKLEDNEKPEEVVINIKRILNVKDKKTIHEIKNLYIGSLLSEGLISKAFLLKQLEKEKTFNYLDFLDTYGLTEDIISVCTDMILSELLGMTIYHQGNAIKVTEKFITTNIVAILNNLAVLTKLIVGIESNGENINNKQGSSAKGYFQFMNGNNGKGRSKGDFSSFETALRRYYLEYSGNKYLPNQKLNSHKKVPTWIVESYNTKGFDPKNLSAVNQTKLFIVDIFNNGKGIKNSAGTKVKVRDFLGLISIGNLWGIKELYKSYHHTDPDDTTLVVIKKYSEKYGKEMIQIK